MSGEIGVKLERQNYRPGERLEGQVAWQLPKPPRSVRIRLFWWTSGKGTRDLSVIEEHTVAAPQAAQMESFAFDLPVEPYSFKGTLITLQWCVEAIADDASHSAVFEMGPEGVSCLLDNRP
jgi:hypothetical protein